MLDLRDEDAVYEDGDFVITRAIRAYSEGMQHGKEWRFTVTSVFRLWYKREYLECHSDREQMVKLIGFVKTYLEDNKIERVVVCDAYRGGELDK